MAKDLSSRTDYHNTKSVKRADTPLAETPIGKKEMTAREYLLSGKPQGTNAPSPKKEVTAKEYLASGKPTKSFTNKAPEGYTKRVSSSGAVDFVPTDKAKEYLSKRK